MDNIALSQGGNICLASGALANGTTAGTIKTTASIPYLIDGTFQTAKGATDNISIAYTGPTVYSAGSVTALNGSFTGQTGGSTRLYGLYLNAAGTVSVEPGPIVNSTDLSNGVAPLMFPPAKRANACFGMLRIALTAGTTFIPGTTALNAAGVTATYLNCGTVPAEPLTA